MKRYGIWRCRIVLAGHSGDGRDPVGNGVRRIQECLCHVLRTLFLTGFLLSPE
jgi:hypothetical protein